MDQTAMRDAIDQAYEGLQARRVNLVQMDYIGQDRKSVV